MSEVKSSYRLHNSVASDCTTTLKFTRARADMKGVRIKFHQHKVQLRVPLAESHGGCVLIKKWEERKYDQNWAAGWVSCLMTSCHETFPPWMTAQPFAAVPISSPTNKNPRQTLSSLCLHWNQCHYTYNLCRRLCTAWMCDVPSCHSDALK